MLFMNCLRMETRRSGSRSTCYRLLRARVGDVRFTIVGQDPPAELIGLDAEGVRVLGGVADLRPLYDEARVFVAPTRFASGIPLKVIHAAAHGLPVVATSLLAKQLAWQDGRELLQADSPDDFAIACATLHEDPVLWDRVRTQRTWSNGRGLFHGCIHQRAQRRPARLSRRRADRSTSLKGPAVLVTSRRSRPSDPGNSNCDRWPVFGSRADANRSRDLFPRSAR